MGKALIYKQILSTYSLRKCMEISLENLYLDIGAERVKFPFLFAAFGEHKQRKEWSTTEKSSLIRGSAKRTNGKRIK